ncbi:hypothetical protein MLD38_032979 [Melastoma candidum]|uniref:Uncharacterized protein n=1 Tax=Melastoma candidum TaxID=119954 RepID=A0ACB9M744_9MYRT|nr:hypothetical protein MLD38_032979 [Melastoma candidum]
MASFSLATSPPIALQKPLASPKFHPIKAAPFSCIWKPSSYRSRSNRRVLIRPVGAAPDKLEDKLADSIKQAEETCAGDSASGECAAAWDEVEELSAAASHARDKKKNADPLEDFCKDNPEDEECRTYED